MSANVVLSFKFRLLPTREQHRAIPQRGEGTSGGVPSSPSLALYSPSAGGVSPTARNHMTGSRRANPGGDNVDRSASARPSGQPIGTQPPGVGGGKIVDVPLAAHGSEKSRHPHSNSRASSTREDTGTAGDILPVNAVPVIPIGVHSPWRTKSREWL